jgi:hypothetical protein
MHPIEASLNQVSGGFEIHAREQEETRARIKPRAVKVISKRS